MKLLDAALSNRFTPEEIEDLKSDPVLAEAFKDSGTDNNTREKFIQTLEHKVKVYQSVCLAELECLWNEAYGANKLTDALDLPERMLRLDSTDPTGYNFKARILDRVTKYEEAREISIQGLDSVGKAARRAHNTNEPTDPASHLWRLLYHRETELWNQQQFKRLKMDVKLPIFLPRHPRDPLRLPLNIVSHILYFLGTRDLSTALRVNHQWQGAVLYCSDFLTSPVFRKYVDIPCVLSYIKLCQTVSVCHCEKVHIHCLTGQEQYVLDALVKSNLKVDDLGLNTRNEDSLLELLQHSRNIQHFFKVPQNFSIHFSEVRSVVHLLRLLRYLRHASSISLTVQRKSPRMALEPDDVPQMTFPHLTNLELLGPADPYLFPAPLLQTTLWALTTPQLEHFHTTWAANRFELIKSVFTEDLTSLILDTDRSLDSFDPIIDELESAESEIKKLVLRGDYFGDDIPHLNLKVLSKLRVLEASCSLLTRENVLSIVKATEGNLIDFGFHSLDRAYTHPPLTEDDFYRELLLLCPKLKRLSPDFQTGLPDCRASCQRIRNALDFSRVSYSLEEIDFRFTNVDDKGLEIFFGEPGSLPRLRRVFGLHSGTSYEMIEKIKRLGIEVEQHIEQAGEVRFWDL